MYTGVNSRVKIRTCTYIFVRVCMCRRCRPVFVLVIIYLNTCVRVLMRVYIYSSCVRVYKHVCMCPKVYVKYLIEDDYAMHLTCELNY